MNWTTPAVEYASTLALWLVRGREGRLEYSNWLPQDHQSEFPQVPGVSGISNSHRSYATHLDLAVQLRLSLAAAKIEYEVAYPERTHPRQREVGRLLSGRGG